MKHVLGTLVWFSCISILGCKPKTGSVYFEAVTNAPEIATGPEIGSSLNVWFVENDGAGHRGYACAYSSRGISLPGGKGLFQSLEALRNEIRSNHSRKVIISEYGGHVPKKWQIRNLTVSELNSLRAD